MKKLLGNLRRKTKEEDFHIETGRTDAKRLTKKESLKRRPQTASRILDEYPTPPEALQPFEYAHALPSIEGIPSLMDSTTDIDAYAKKNGRLSGLDFGNFELPKERALPNVRQYEQVYHRPIAYEEVVLDNQADQDMEAGMDSFTSETYASETSMGTETLDVSPQNVDVGAAVNLLSTLRKTASPGELAALREYPAEESSRS
jgi:hypothetical protein